jgi:hypothetical protein
MGSAASRNCAIGSGALSLEMLLNDVDIVYTVPVATPDITTCSTSFIDAFAHSCSSSASGRWTINITVELASIEKLLSILSAEDVDVAKESVIAIFTVTAEDASVLHNIICVMFAT